MSKLGWQQVIIGVLALSLGVVLYLVDRPSSQVYFIPHELSLFQGHDSVFGVLGNHLPTFLHVFAFSLITSGVLACDRRGAMWVCVIWFSVDALFEAGQHSALAKVIVPMIPDWFSQVPILENTAPYFLNGSFDALDLVSILLGAISAYVAILILTTIRAVDG